MADVFDAAPEPRLKALAIFENLLAAQPDNAGLQREVALVHKNIAAPLTRRQEKDRALPHLRRAEELDARRVAADPRSSEAQMDLSFDYSQNGTFYWNRSQFTAALENFQKAFEIRRRLAQSDPADARLQSLERRQQLMTALTLLAPAPCGVRVARTAARASVPGRAGRSQRVIDRGGRRFTTSRSRSCSPTSNRTSSCQVRSPDGRTNQLVPLSGNRPARRPDNRCRTTCFQYAAWTTSSQMLWRPRPGRHAACFGVTPRSAV